MQIGNGGLTGGENAYNNAFPTSWILGQIVKAIQILSESAFCFSDDRFMTFWEDSVSNPTASMDHEKTYGRQNSDGAFNPTFPSLHNVSEDSTRPCILDSMPYQINGDHSSEEALKKIRTANTIAISPGKTLGSIDSISHDYVANTVYRTLREAVSKPPKSRQGRSSL